MAQKQKGMIWKLINYVFPEPKKEVSKMTNLDNNIIYEKLAVVEEKRKTGRPRKQK